MNMMIEIVSWLLILAGSFFTVVGAFGLMRLPDVFSRMHAVSLIDTLGIGLLILGMAVQAGFSLVTLKLFFLLALVFFTWPVVTHALAQATLQAGIEPMLTEDRRSQRSALADGPDKGRPSSN